MGDTPAVLLFSAAGFIAAYESAHLDHTFGILGWVSAGLSLALPALMAIVSTRTRRKFRERNKTYAPSGTPSSSSSRGSVESEPR